MKDFYYCIGHIQNFKQGKTELQVNNIPIRIERERDEIKYITTDRYDIHTIKKDGLIWVYKGDKPVIPSIKEMNEKTPNQVFEITYNAPYKIVYENLWDLNHVQGTHENTALATELTITDFKPGDNQASLILRSQVALPKKSNLLTKVFYFLFGRMFGGGEQINKVNLYYPGLISFNNDVGIKSIIVAGIYPISDEKTKFFLVSTIFAHPIVVAFFNSISNARTKQVLIEDAEILEHAYLRYKRKIVLTEDEPVDFARTLL